MKCIVALSVLILTSATCIAQNASLTLCPRNHIAKTAEGGAQPDSVCFYGGDFDHRNGCTSERNTSVSDSWTFDDFAWAGGRVDTAFGDFLDTGIGQPAGGDVVVYSGMSEGHFGTLVGEARDVADINWQPRDLLDPIMMQLTVHLGGQAFDLPAGTYHVGIRPVGTGQGQAYVPITSGAGSVGEPIANGNTFLQSEFFGYPEPTDWQNLLGTGNWDVSFGLQCGGDHYSLFVSGDCPGTIDISWQYARPDAQQAIIYSAGMGHAPIPGPCGNIPSGLASVTLHLPAFNTINGNWHVQGQVSESACGKYIQLVTFTRGPCLTSNVARLP